MGVVVNQGIKSSLFTYIGVIIGTFNVLYLYPKFLQPDEIGIMRLLLDISFVLAALSQIGTPNLADKFFPFFQSVEKKHNGFFLLILLFPFIGFLFFALIYILLEGQWKELFEERSDRINEYFYHVLPLMFFVVYQTVLEAYVRVHLRIVVPGIIREIFLRVWVLVLIIIYATGFISFEGLIDSIIFSYFLAVVLLLLYVQRMRTFFLSMPNLRSNPLLKEMLVFSFYVFLGSASFIIAARIDVIMISAIEGLAATGIFTIAFFIGTIIEIPKRSLSQITVPLIAQAWKKNDLGIIRMLYQKSSINQLFASLFLFLLIWLNIDFIYQLMPNSDIYSQGKYVIFFFGLSKVVDMATGVNSEIINTSKYYKFNLVFVLILGFLNFLLNYLFIPIYGITGAAVATLITYIVFNGVKYLFILKKMNMQPFNLSSFFIILIALLTFALIDFMPVIMSDVNFMAFYNIVLRSTIIVIVFVGGCLFFNLVEDVKIVFLKGIGRIGK
jgi:O-antigen/teichoic acid export membrane protein